MSDEQFERDQKSLANLRVGAWASQCCHHDLAPIEEEDLDHIREQLTDPSVTKEGWMVWPTRREALLYMREGAEGETLQEIDAMLAEDAAPTENAEP